MFGNLRSLFNNKREFSPIDPYVLVEQTTIQQVQLSVTNMLNRIQSEELMNGSLSSSTEMLRDYLKVFQGTCNLFGAVGNQQVVLGGVKPPPLMRSQADTLSCLLTCWEQGPAVDSDVVSQVYEYLINYDQRIPFTALPEVVQDVVRAYYAACSLMSAETYKAFRGRDKSVFRSRMLSSLCYYFPAVTLEAILKMGWDPSVFSKYTCGYTKDFVYSEVRPLVTKMSQLLKTQVINPDSLSAKIRPIIVALVNNCVAYWSGNGFPKPEFQVGQATPPGYTPNSVADRNLIKMFEKTLAEYKELSTADKEFAEIFKGDFDVTKWSTIPGLQTSIVYLMDIIALCQADSQEQELAAAVVSGGKSKSANIFSAAAAAFTRKKNPDSAETFTSKFTERPDEIEPEDIFNTGAPVKPPRKGNMVPPQEFGRIVSGWIQMSASNPAFGIGIKVTNKAGAMFGNRADYTAGFEVMGVAPEDMDDELQLDIEEFVTSASKLVQKNQRSLRATEPTYLIVFPTTAIMGPPIQIDFQTGLSIVQQNHMSEKYYHAKLEQVRRASDAAHSRDTKNSSTRGNKRGQRSEGSVGGSTGGGTSRQSGSSGTRVGSDVQFGVGNTDQNGFESDFGSVPDFDNGLNSERGPVSLSGSPQGFAPVGQQASTQAGRQSNRRATSSDNTGAEEQTTFNWDTSTDTLGQGVVDSTRTAPMDHMPDSTRSAPQGGAAEQKPKKRERMTVANSAIIRPEYQVKPKEEEDPELADWAASKSGFGSDVDKALSAGKNIADQLRASLAGLKSEADKGAKTVADTKTSDLNVETISLFADEIAAEEQKNREASMSADRRAHEEVKSVENDLADFMRASADVADSLKVSHMVEARLCKFLNSYEFAIREIKSNSQITVSQVRAAEGDTSEYLNKFMQVLRKTNVAELASVIQGEYDKLRTAIESTFVKSNATSSVGQIRDYLLTELSSTFEMLKSEVLKPIMA